MIKPFTKSRRLHGRQLDAITYDRTEVFGL
jgi:hypothetical protein